MRCHVSCRQKRFCLTHAPSFLFCFLPSFVVIILSRMRSDDDETVAEAEDADEGVRENERGQTRNRGIRPSHQNRRKAWDGKCGYPKDLRWIWSESAILDFNDFPFMFKTCFYSLHSIWLPTSCFSWMKVKQSVVFQRSLSPSTFLSGTFLSIVDVAIEKTRRFFFFKNRRKVREGMCVACLYGCAHARERRCTLERIRKVSNPFRERPTNMVMYKYIYIAIVISGILSDDADNDHCYQLEVSRWIKMTTRMMNREISPEIR